MILLLGVSLIDQQTSKIYDGCKEDSELQRKVMMEMSSSGAVVKRRREKRNRKKQRNSSMLFLQKTVYLKVLQQKVFKIKIRNSSASLTVAFHGILRAGEGSWPVVP